MKVLGIDIGGTGIKSNIIDTETGEILGDKFKIKTPQPATPKSIKKALKGIVSHFNWENKKVGICFPAVIQNGRSLTASNIDKEFIGYNLEKEFSKALNTEVTVVNDADAAGLAEMTIGKGRGATGVVLFITLGTGIGSALFYKGQLIPNSELGQLLYKKSIFENYASNRARESKKLTWKEWGSELNVFLNHVHILFTPEHIFIGGGVSKNFDKYSKYLDVPCKIETASLLNNAGLVGAAMVASYKK